MIVKAFPETRSLYSLPRSGEALLYKGVREVQDFRPLAKVPFRFLSLQKPHKTEYDSHGKVEIIYPTEVVLYLDDKGQLRDTP